MPAPYETYALLQAALAESDVLIYKMVARLDDSGYYAITVFYDDDGQLAFVSDLDITPELAILQTVNTVLEYHEA
jgi:hypothetical protein